MAPDDTTRVSLPPAVAVSRRRRRFDIAHHDDERDRRQHDRPAAIASPMRPPRGAVDGADGLGCETQIGVDRFERGADFAGALVALRGFLREAAQDDRPEHRRHARRKRVRRGPQDRGSQIELRSSLKGQPSGRHLVEHDAERPDVAACVRALAEEHFRRNVGQRPASTPGSAMSTDCVAPR